MQRSLITLFALAFIFASCNKKPEKPNIVFIFADDQCYNTVHALGNDEIITPNIDRMVESGVTFTHAYNMGAWNGAVCMASRAMLNTGRSVWRAHDIDKNHYKGVGDGEMWGQLMQKAGYNTYMTGKWHVGIGAEKCFQNVVHVRPGMPMDEWGRRKLWKVIKDSVETGLLTMEDIMPLGYNRPNKEGWSPTDPKFGGYWEGGKHWSEVLADDAEMFIDSASARDEPFFMYLAFNAAHDPRQSPQKFIDMYPLENISIPKNFQPLYPYKDDIGCGPTLRDAALAPFPRTKEAVRLHRQEYYALITHMDQQIGKILDKLEKSGKMDNTYIFYTADHGLATGQHGLFGKQNMYDHSIRTPFIVIGPDVPKNKKIDIDIYLQDIMASSIDLAGLPKPEYVEFNSIMPIIRGEREKSYYDAIYGCYLERDQRMIRKDGFKLIVYPRIKVMLLYDMVNDPLEMNDLASLDQFSTKKDELFKDLIQLQKKMGDQLNLEEIFE